MKEILEDVIDICCSFWERLMAYLLAALIVVTSPIWVVPYVLYLHLKYKN